ncbi:MAG TPA: lanthionine synthetase LanC family protein [Thermoanaerobaculia bacterium]|jgi:lantibiotic modifying enzyme|nr:lanthionine synthetase LanC family protein [Thermoanaerobaculia bacterium]
MSNSGAASLFVENAEALGQQIWKQRVQAADGTITWLRPGSEARGEPIDLQKRIDPFLYDGTAGIALFLSGLSYVTKDDGWRDRALQTIAPVRRKLAELTGNPERAVLLTGLGLGGMIGLGSLVYSFLHIGRLLEESALRDESLRIAGLITQDRIDRDETCDILYGGAGAILALLRLGADAPLHTAIACAHNLLRRRQAVAGAVRTWRTLPGLPPMGGFSHGAAGICCALLCLYRHTGDPDLLAAAREGFAFERTLYSPEQRGWRDAKVEGEIRVSPGWCFGSAGMALARLSALETLDSPELRQEAEQGLEHVLSAPLSNVDHLCCGNLGRVDSLLQAGWTTAAEELAHRALERAGRRGGLVWRSVMPPDLFDPTFFTGAAGTGYTLLRLANHSLPCVLALE